MLRLGDASIMHRLRSELEQSAHVPAQALSQEQRLVLWQPGVNLQEAPDLLTVHLDQAGSDVFVAPMEFLRCHRTEPVLHVGVSLVPARFLVLEIAHVLLWLSVRRIDRFGHLLTHVVCSRISIGMRSIVARLRWLLLFGIRVMRVLRVIRVVRAMRVVRARLWVHLGQSRRRRMPV